MRHRVLPVVSWLLVSFALLLLPLPAQASPLPIYIPLAMNGIAEDGCQPEFDFIPSADEANETAIFLAMNEQRALFGLEPLTLDADLTQSSRLHSEDMAFNDFTEHEGSDGSSGGDRINLTCYEWDTWGENIGWGYGGDIDLMMDFWLNSPPHRAAILNPDFEDVGIGYAVNPDSEWGHYWTVNFATRR